MKHRALAVIFFAFLTSFISAQGFDKFAATVNLARPAVISVKQLERRIQEILEMRTMAGMPAVQVTQQDKLNILDMMISEELLQQGIEQSGITVSEQELDSVIEDQKMAVEQQNGVKITLDQFRNAVTSQANISWDEYVGEIRSQLEQQKYISQERGEYIQTNLKVPTDGEIEDFYYENRSEFTNPEIIRYSHVFFSTLNLNSSEKNDILNRAEKAYLEYQNGDTSFEELVREYTDDSRSKVSGGDAGFIARGDSTAKAYLGDTFVRELFKVKVGEVKGVLESNIGYHIVRITDHREARILSITDPIAPNSTTTVKNFIASQLFQQKQQMVLAMAVEDLAAELRKEAEIVTFPENLD